MRTLVYENKRFSGGSWRHVLPGAGVGCFGLVAGTVVAVAVLSRILDWLVSGAIPAAMFDSYQ